MKKSLLSLLLLVAMLMTTSFSVNAETNNNENGNTYEELANVLKEAGFFKGTDKGFELEKELSRGEAAAMLVRMLGKEAQVTATTYEHPFTDVPEWADAYVGYLYVNGMTNGVTMTSFGTDDSITGPQYFTFVLRALGYDDQAGDFTWDQSLEKAKELEILNDEEYQKLNKDVFIRDYAVLGTFNGLQAKAKDSDESLIMVLNGRGDVSEASMKAIVEFVPELMENTNESMDSETAMDGAAQVEALLSRSEGALKTIKNLSVIQTIDMKLVAIDPETNLEFIGMAFDLTTESKIDYTNTKASSILTGNVNMLGMSIDVNEESYADKDVYYVYTGESVFMGMTQEESLYDYFGLEEKMEDYKSLFESAEFMTGDNSLDEMNDSGMKSAEFDGMTIEMTETEYIITGDEGFDELLAGVDELSNEQDIEINEFIMKIDKKTGVMSYIYMDFSGEDEEANVMSGTLEFIVSNIDSTVVEKSSNVQRMLDEDKLQLPETETETETE